MSVNYVFIRKHVNHVFTRVFIHTRIACNTKRLKTEKEESPR